MSHEMTELFLSDVRDEVQRAREKFPQPNASMCALTEEVGELAKALMDEPRSRVWKEAVQVAAMAVRVAVEGDPTLSETRKKRGADASLNDVCDPAWQAVNKLHGGALS